MIQELKFKNFMSFRDEATISFEATKDNTFEDYQVVEVMPGVRLLRFAMVYGANASGKSNLLDAISFLRDFANNRTEDIEQQTGVMPFLLDPFTQEKPTEFSLKFFVGETRYWYELILDRNKVYKERLYYYTSVQPTKLFDRYLQDDKSVIEINPAVTKISFAAKEELIAKCLPNMSFFAARKQVNMSMKEIDAAQEWLRKGMMPNVEPQSNLFDYANRKLLDNNLLKQYLLDFVHEADFNIADINTDLIKKPVSQTVVDMMMRMNTIPADMKEKLKNEQMVDSVRTLFVHKVTNERGEEKYNLPTNSQSAGTKRTIGIETAIYEAIGRQAFLSIDEIDSSLHPMLVELVIQKFLSQKSRSQLLVTTHYDPLLKTVGDELIRRDSVWFTEKDMTGNSELYSLVEYKGLNRIPSLQKAYRNGVFGALPNIK